MYEHIIAYWGHVADVCIKMAKDEGTDVIGRHALFLGAESSLAQVTAYTRLACQAEERRAA